MRKYLDIPLTLIVGLALTVAMLWPLDAPPPAPEGSDKLVHLIAFAALAFPLRLGNCPGQTAFEDPQRSLPRAERAARHEASPRGLRARARLCPRALESHHQP